MSCLTFARLFWNQFYALCQLSCKVGAGSTYVNLVQRNTKVFREALLGAGTRLVMLLKVTLEDVMLFFGPRHRRLVNEVLPLVVLNRLTDVASRRRSPGALQVLVPLRQQRILVRKAAVGWQHRCCSHRTAWERRTGFVQDAQRGQRGQRRAEGVFGRAQQQGGPERNVVRFAGSLDAQDGGLWYEVGSFLWSRWVVATGRAQETGSAENEGWGVR